MITGNQSATFGFWFNQVTPHLLEVVFLLVVCFGIIVSAVILYHLNKYQKYSPATILAQTVYIFGLIVLLVIAFVFLILFIT